jgi:hypothetical protein
MAEFSALDVEMAISKTVESPFGSPVESAANLLGFVTTSQGFASPKVEKITDEGKLGNGSEHPRRVRNAYWELISGSISDDLNTGIAALLTRRAAGGSVTTTEVVTDEVWDHEFTLQTKAQGRQLPGSTIYMNVGGESWGLAGAVVGQFTISQEGGNSPTFNADMRTIGRHKLISTISPSLNLPAPTPENYIFGADVLIEFNNGSLLNVSNRVLNLNLTLNNQLIEQDRRPGDPALVTGDYAQGAYMARLQRGDRKCEVSLTLALNENMVEYDAMKNNTDITGFRYRARGPKIGTFAGTDYYHEYEWRYPRCVAFEAMMEGGQPLRRRLMLMPFQADGQNYVNWRIRTATDTLV